MIMAKRPPYMKRGQKGSSLYLTFIFGNRKLAIHFLRRVNSDKI
jgi:hypothetical protein